MCDRKAVHLYRCVSKHSTSCWFSSHPVPLYSAFAKSLWLGSSVGSAARQSSNVQGASVYPSIHLILLYYFTHVLAMCFIFISPTSCTSPSCSVRYSRVDGLQRHRVDDALCRPSFLEFKFSRLLLIPFLLFPHVCFYRRALCTQPGLHSLRMPKIQPRCFVSWRWSFIAMCRKPFSSGRSTTTRDSLVAVKLRARPRVTSRKLESG